MSRGYTYDPQDPVVEARVQIVGGWLAYGPNPYLHAALCHLVPAWHGDGGEGVQIVGGVAGGGVMLVRLPLSRAGEVDALAHKELRVGSGTMHTGAMHLQGIAPPLSPVTLRAALVAPSFTKKGQDRSGYDEERFRAWVQGWASERGVQVRVGPQGAITMHNRLKHLGHALDLLRVPPALAVALMSEGLGGRRRMGCGCFVVEGDAPAELPKRTPTGDRYRQAPKPSGPKRIYTPTGGRGDVCEARVMSSLGVCAPCLGGGAR